MIRFVFIAIFWIRVITSAEAEPKSSSRSGYELFYYDGSDARESRNERGIKSRGSGGQSRSGQSATRMFNDPLNSCMSQHESMTFGSTGSYMMRMADGRVLKIKFIVDDFDFADTYDAGSNSESPSNSYEQPQGSETLFRSNTGSRRPAASSYDPPGSSIGSGDWLPVRTGSSINSNSSGRKNRPSSSSSSFGGRHGQGKGPRRGQGSRDDPPGQEYHPPTSEGTVNTGYFPPNLGKGSLGNTRSGKYGPTQTTRTSGRPKGLNSNYEAPSGGQQGSQPDRATTRKGSKAPNAGYGAPKGSSSRPNVSGKGDGVTLSNGRNIHLHIPKDSLPLVLEYLLRGSQSSKSHDYVINPVLL